MELRITHLIYIAISGLICAACTQVKANELAIGAKSKIRTPIVVPINKPVALNFKTRSEVLELRRGAVAATQALLTSTYQPNPDIFNQIEDRKPWWGLSGQAAFGKGEHAILGKAEESRFILNPFLLVGINSATNGIWNTRKLTIAEIDSDSFPYYWVPSQLIFDPRNNRAAASYAVGDYLRMIHRSGKLKSMQMPNQFSLVAYNARDFGFNYAYLDTGASKNVKNTEVVEKPAKINQFIHCGGSCGYPGGCNNMSPFTRELDRCYLEGLPARAIIKLWKARPENIAQTPDFTFAVDFR